MSHYVGSKFRQIIRLIAVACMIVGSLSLTPSLEADSDSKALKKWEDAVIHFESVFDFGMFEERIKNEPKFKAHILQALQLKLLKKEISEEKYDLARRNNYDLYDVFVKDLRIRGTAVFINRDERMYLITARHLIEDKVTKRAFWNLFFPLRIDDMFSSSKIPIPRLIGLSQNSRIGNCSLHPELDLAIISLSRKDVGFLGTQLVDVLLSLGRSPISMSDILLEPSSVGAEVFTVGFPEGTSLVGERELTVTYHWDTDVISMPTFAFGRVAMLHPKLEYFWCDMSAYPGNSGAPVIENGRMVGIVSMQATTPDTGRIPFCAAIKAKHIQDLVEIQINKDNKKKNTQK